MTVSATLLGVLLKGVAASRPAANAVAGGTIYSATDTGAISQSDGSSWATWATISSGLADPMTTRGDLIYRNSSNTTARLPIGSSGKFLSSDGTDVSWQTPAGGTTSCLATRTTSQSVGANPTMIALNATDIYDPDGWHDPSTNNTRLTCPSGKGGKVFHCFVSLEYDHGGTTFRLGIKKNGTTVSSGALNPDQTYIASHSGMIYLADGDYIEAGIYNRTTGNIIVTDQNAFVGVMG